MKIIGVILLALCFFSCSHTERKVQIRKGDKNEIGLVEYTKIKNYGNYINAVLNSANKTAFYNLKVNDVGVIQHVLKFYKRKTAEVPNIDYFRDMQFLVTDTSELSNASFFGYPISGYFNDSIVNNVIFSKNVKAYSVPLLPEEAKLFYEIDSLVNTRKISFIMFDTSRIIGWFKYQF